MRRGGDTPVGDRLGFLSASGAVAAVLMLLGTLAWTVYAGPVLFSPGLLSAASKARIVGGVSSHAGLESDCGACHTAPWDPRTMADRCVACHTDVAVEIRSRTGMHGWLLGALSSPTCGGCHPDHRGPNGLLTDFDHGTFRFPLLGKHAHVPCAQCHATARSLRDFQNTPQDCYSCHAKDDTHKGAFGRQCDQCHSTAGWPGAKFDHTVFPLDHGAEEQAATCKTCHPTVFSAYTCFGCHRHTPANVQADHEGRSAAELADCIRCHAGGRRGDD